LLIALRAFAASTVFCALVLAALRRWTVLDNPNARSSHARPVPRGGGLGFVPVILLGWWLLTPGAAAVPPAVLIGALAIALVSFADDLRGVPIGVRLAVQAAAIAAVLATAPMGPVVSAALPPIADRLIAGLLWLWFVNLFNFMDGIDGIAASEAAIIAGGIAVLAFLHPELVLPAREAVVVGAAVLAFLLFNWPPARMFMGDAGSVTLGFLLGWLLIETAAAGAAPAAILLPLYFSADATSTLLMRGWRRENIAEAHRSHAYQRAVDRGQSHALTTLTVVGLGAALILLALLSVTWPAPALVGGPLLAGALIAWQRRAR
jgi:UDP-N-acetylmuramyl pentapeptide phosphotransferase/UDP-N-acetylglucosamine-1-phosphate transferase